MADTGHKHLDFDHRGRNHKISYFLRKGSRGSILYLHGLGSTKEDFLPASQIPGFDDYTLVSFDFPGCGKDHFYFSETPLGIDDLVDATHKIVTELGLNFNLTIIAHSMGGLAGLQFCHQFPELVSRFINVEGNLAPEDCYIQSRDVFRYRFLGDEDRFFDRLLGDMMNSSKPGFAEFARCLRGNIADRAYFDFCRSIVDYSENMPLLDQFVSLQMPKLFIHGEANSSLTYLPRLAEAGLNVVSVPDSDHLPAFTNPAFYYGAISSFIKETALPIPENLCFE